ncbi:hypothetical protein [Streptomyces erythrochromogenes]|uniref:hypothetical protein n=1 Tax=Streptomyces erythrochromogenes TaxID=285574 RepID=UPI002258F554|nr:hypothetical protein [Streptomyces erythrochromogenes]MCX5583679.1 hypothetical protein [Streptomyces erythrochromogenes]
MNTFRGTDGRHLEMTNGGTAVFVDVLVLAVSTLAREPWDFRFAALLTLQDQNVMGRGVVGFGLAELDLGDAPQERAAAKGFLLCVLDLALSRHRWDELTYEPARAEGYSRTYRAMVEAFDPETAGAETAVRTAAGPGGPPGPDQAAMASCTAHRVLDALPFWEGCVFCTGGVSATNGGPAR